MTFFLAPAEFAIAKASYEFWRSKAAPHMHACCLTACEGGETGFKWLKDASGKPYTPAGDHGQAKGVLQWWPARGDDIKKHTGFDVRDGTHLEMLNGAFCEMTQAWSPYRHVWPNLMAAKTMWAAMTVLVEQEERSKSQASDIMKRTAIAVYLDHVMRPAADVA